MKQKVIEKTLWTFDGILIVFIPIIMYLIIEGQLEVFEIIIREMDKVI